MGNSWSLKANQSTTYTESEVDAQFYNLIDSAHDALNALNELAAALNDDSNYATTTQNQWATQQHNIDPVPPTAESLFEIDDIKRVFGVSPLNINTHFNSKDLSAPTHANLETSTNDTDFGSITCNALISNPFIQCGDLTASAIYCGAVVQIQQTIDNAMSAAALSAERPLSITDWPLTITASIGKH